MMTIECNSLEVEQSILGGFFLWGEELREKVGIVEQIVSMLGFATDYISMLAYSRMKQLKDWKYFVSPSKDREGE